MRDDTRTLEEKTADRNAKLDALHEKLSGAVEQLVTGEDWLRALAFAARFRARSFNNTLLIAMQHAIAHAEGLVPSADPTYVAGFKQWKALDRSVRKGQPGYQIYAPVTARMATFSPESGPWRRLGRGEKPEPGEIVRSRIVGLRPAYVWDVSQTDGKPVPEPPPSVQMPAGQAPAGLWDGLAALVAERGYDLQIVPDPTALGGALGRTTYPTKLVEICDSLDDAAKTAVLTHELAHIDLHAPGRDRAPSDGTLTSEPATVSQHRGIREVEADSVAYMVNASHGLTTDSSTIPYIADWASTVPGTSIAETVQSTATRVRDAAIKILDGLDTHQIPDGTPPGLDRDALRASSRTAKSRRTPTPVDGSARQTQVRPSTAPTEELGL
ncbi:hypothetical protein C8K30_115104 [Promicromonospora sp. AC04]|uniref:ArdC family protein n=1 Tax=Promicromonospora sp. AC04 TaxID=2135723 RepID=UPI000D4A7FA4|nr:ArdC family protein [Promicromonospora sp. AC04]PUB20893.1 hypothetical protein C8K30_115104 [Promicromonospora sp. AC04]